METSPKIRLILEALDDLAVLVRGGLCDFFCLFVFLGLTDTFASTLGLPVVQLYQHKSASASKYSVFCSGNWHLLYWQKHFLARVSCGY